MIQRAVDNYRSLALIPDSCMHNKQSYTSHNIIASMESAERKHPTYSFFVRHIALPQDHGSWVFLLSPLLIGLFTAMNWSAATKYLVLCSFSAFLIRQPVTIAVKAYSGRRSHRELPAAWFWIAVYGLIASCGLVGLFMLGFGYLLYLAIPGIPVFVWHLYLVSRREERRQLGIELVGSGVLALAAPAAYWTGVGRPELIGWLLFLLVWLQSAASIVYAYLRLEQRTIDIVPKPLELLRLGKRAILYATFNLTCAGLISLVHLTSPWIFLPYLLQWLETLQGVFNPAIKQKPTAIGVRQLIVSTLFTILFILAWHV